MAGSLESPYPADGLETLPDDNNVHGESYESVNPNDDPYTLAAWTNNAASTNHQATPTIPQQNNN